VFAQGCDLCCEGCQNPETWERNGGEEMTVDHVIAEMLVNPLTDGLSLTGGEPFLQTGDCVKIASAARSKGLNVWLFSGFTYEELIMRAETEPETRALLELSDVLVDGRFVYAERSLLLRWRGSHNQRVIDVAKSLKAGKAVLFLQ
jgi:anaerobic ribonucleoside-triphosphate reductase activating protein